MANDITSLLPILIEEQSIPFLRSRGGLIKNVFTVRQNTVAARGGETVRVTMPNAPQAPQDVNYVTATAAQNITLPSVNVTTNQHKERKIALTDIEARISQGNEMRILTETITGMINDLIIEAETYVATLWPYFPIIGANNVYLNDTTMRLALAALQRNRVDPKRDTVVFRGTINQYTRDLLNIDRYVLAINQGQGMNGSASVLESGVIPSLYNMNADWSHAMPTQTFSGASTEVGMMFEKHAIGMAFLQFAPMVGMTNGTALVNEQFTTDSDSGITIRWQTYLDMSVRTKYLQADICYGAGALDATRGIALLSKTA